jgi:uncharacterized membrane protein
MDRITAIRKSLTCFVCGLIGFLPVIGVIPAIFALVGWAQISARYGKQWNPAATYLSWGARLAALGLLASLILVAVALMAFALQAFNE